MPASSGSWIVRREEDTNDHHSFAIDRLVEMETFNSHILCTCPSIVAKEMQRLFDVFPLSVCSCRCLSRPARVRPPVCTPYQG